ncbi:MAG: ABC transporter substrate-binding protein [Dehalococcoidia bacterium]
MDSKAMYRKILRAAMLTGLILIITVGTMLMGGCTTQTEGTTGPEETTETPVTYTIADTTGDWGYPSPYTHYSRGPGYIRMSFIFDTLVWKDKSEFVPALAESWEYLESENAYVFNLREGVTWHDGEEFNAEDVVFTINYVEEHPLPFVTLQGPSGIEKAQALDNYTVKLFLEQPYAAFLNDVAGTLAILPEHIWSDVEKPEEFSGPEAVVGTGPYKLVNYSKEHGTYLYKAYKNYYLGEPSVDKLKFVKVNQQMIPAALKQGEVDAGDIPAELVQEMQSEDFTAIQAPCGWNAKLMLNHKDAPLSNKEFRHALAYAIDRESLVETVLRGYATPGSAGMVPPDSEWYNSDIKQYDYDPEKAKELLKELGYKYSDDSFTKDGEPLELELLTSPRAPFPDVAEFIEKELEKIGVTVALRSLEAKSLDARVEAWEFDLSVYGHGGLYEPSILNKVITGKGFNSARYTESKELNQLLQAQLQEMDHSKRKELVAQVQEVYAEELPALTLYYPNWYWAHNGEVELFYTNGGVASGIPVPLNKLAFVR